MQHVPWSRNANIYEVNVRQFTPEGTFAAFERHLPRLQAMGVDILWLMPIHPIGETHRKGTLGSYYSVRDHHAVNPEFGSLADFRRLVGAVHALGMKIVIDWVANHTAWDHAWVREHPDWYRRTELGEIHPCSFDNGREVEHWSDVVGLDYTEPALWPAMIDAMAFWVREVGIDGFRCDVAMLVPTRFWERARVELERLKPLFMLAEASQPDLHDKAFDMTYDWSLHDAMARIARGDGDVDELASHLDARAARSPDAYRMLFTSNHDKNAWEGSDAERFGASFEAFAVIAATLPGMPLIYGGQESWLDKRVAFFEKDTIDWKDYPLADFYAGLLRLKHDNPALWNGAAGGDLELLPCSSRAVLAYRRRRADRCVAVIANLSAAPQHVCRTGETIRLDPWAYRIESR